MTRQRSLKLLNEEIIACRKCPRLVTFREKVAKEKRRQFADFEYWGRPVTGFGDPKAKLNCDRPRASRLTVEIEPGGSSQEMPARNFS